MNYVKFIIIGITCIICASCSNKSIEQAEPILYGAGAYGIANEVQEDKKISAGAGVAGFLIGKGLQSKKAKNEVAEIDAARAEGKQQVMMDLFWSKYSEQRDLASQGTHEVRVPFESYTTSDGVQLEAHEKVVLTR